MNGFLPRLGDFSANFRFLGNPVVLATAKSVKKKAFSMSFSIEEIYCDFTSIVINIIILKSHIAAFSIDLIGKKNYYLSYFIVSFAIYPCY